MTRLLALALVLFVGCSGPTAVSDPAPDRPASRAPAGDGPKPYGDVITDAVVSDPGLFTVHRLDGTLMVEIPDSLFGRDLLSVSRIAQVPTGLGAYIPAGSKTAERVLRWERDGNTVRLRTQSYTAVADESLPISESVEANNFQPVLASFGVAAISPDSSGVVVDVTSLYTTDVASLSGLSQRQRTQFRVRSLDKARTFIDEAAAFPENVNVRYTLTYTAASPPQRDGSGTISMQMYHSYVLLPEEPMMPRLADDRVGYFSVRQVDYGRPDQKATERTFIRRWRLVPSDTAAYMRGELVEPVEPITYVLDRATPDRWRSYFCQGVEDWNVAFERAGFRNAIRCLLPPAEDDPSALDPEDVRQSTVRYVASTTRNATGPSVSDPRSGEIIESDIVWYHNHIRSYRNRLMIETGAANPQARSLTIPEALIGETMRQVIAHEIGHAIGLPHNMVASSSFPVDSLRSPSFTSEYGVAASIMDYARQNYIAQPGDGVTRFVRGIGPYDLYSVEWGYRWYPDVTTPDDETDALDAMIEAHADDDRFRFASSAGSFNPDAQTEDLGDDPVAASGYGIDNLRRVVPNLVAWTSTPGEGYDDTEEIYGELLGMWRRYLGHVTTVVGGVRQTPKATDQPGVVFETVPRAEQERALAFLAEEAFATPTWLLDADLLRRMQPVGAVDRVRGIQVGILRGLLSPMRMARLIEAEAIDATAGADAYPLSDFMEDVRELVWTELDGRQPVINPFRRNLQRGYVEHLSELMMADEPNVSGPFRELIVDISQSDVRASARGALLRVMDEAERAVDSTRDAATRDHLVDIVARIDHTLDPD